MPLQFRETNEREHGEVAQQIKVLNDIYGEVAEIHGAGGSRQGGSPECDAVLFPQLIGAAYHYMDTLKNITSL